MSFELTILGSSSALPTPKRNPTAHLLHAGERFFLIDCAEGTQMQLMRYGVNAARIHHIFISHMHGDHVYGLTGLLSSLGMLGRKKEMNLYGPAALKNWMDKHARTFGAFPFELNFQEVKEDGQLCFENKKIEVTALKLEHRGPTFGYLFREKALPLNVRKDKIEDYSLGIADVVRVKRGEDHELPDGTLVPNEELTLPPYCRRSYAYISDTGFIPALADKLKDVDLLYHEATFAEEDHELAGQTKHSTARQAAEIAKMAGARQLLIGHFSNRYRDVAVLEAEAAAVFPAVRAVEDGQHYGVEQERVSKE